MTALTDEPPENTEPQSIVQRIAERAKEEPDAPVLVHIDIDGRERPLGWAELDRRSSQVAAALVERGVDIGDRVAIGFRNSPEFVFSTFATWKVGATPIPVRWDLPDWELARLREVIDPKVLLSADDLEWIASTAADPVPTLPDVVAPRLHGICSSGSTGTPKVIVASIPAIFYPLFSTPMMERWRPVERPQTILVLAPMYHINAFVTLHNLLAGDRVVVMEKFDASRVVDAIERHRVTTFTATPTMLQRVADLPGVDDRDLSSIDFFLQGAAPMPPSLVHRWAGLVGPERILMAYGMTEAIGTTALDGQEWLAHQGSVGRGQNGTEIKVLDEAGQQLPTGEVGDVYLRGPAYGGSTYLGEAPQMRGTDDGFSTVGDVGYLDDDGYLYVVDRRVDMIITGGANVFPAEVEHALIDHPDIADVVVVGLLDDEWGRRVHAIIEAADPSAPPSADDVIAYAKQRLAAYKVPKTIELIDAIPRSEATKVNRGRLVEARGG
ncbi:MAG TPA: AMP-binding protein [Microthrixaceae bacterium]|nr:AMP-binding protein [Microthrixaceae bacterium]